jgi:phosphosulfolactate phosphohydrolase-like enzyme
VLLASRLNLEAVLQVLAEAAGLQLQIVCAGTNEAPALEDTYLAGRICAALPGERTDAALIAEAVARSYETPFEALAASADARALSAAGLAADTAHCALESRLQVVPRVLSASDGTAMVGPQNTVQADLLATAMPSSQRLLSDRTRQTR